MAQPADFLIEFHQQGSWVKVTAIDPVSGAEASITGDARTPQDQLAALAVRRLTSLQNPSAPDQPESNPDTRPGLIV